MNLMIHDVYVCVYVLRFSIFIAIFLAFCNFIFRQYFFRFFHFLFCMLWNLITFESFFLFIVHNLIFFWVISNVAFKLISNIISSCTFHLLNHFLPCHLLNHHVFSIFQVRSAKYWLCAVDIGQTEFKGIKEFRKMFAWKVVNCIYSFDVHRYRHNVRIYIIIAWNKRITKCDVDIFVTEFFFACCFFHSSEKLHKINTANENSLCLPGVHIFFAHLLRLFNVVCFILPNLNRSVLNSCAPKKNNIK